MVAAPKASGHNLGNSFQYGAEHSRTQGRSETAVGGGVTGNRRGTEKGGGCEVGERGGIVPNLTH